ncbi:hypothetical protein BDQ12DRAFT_677085 [Crucibulum laeve]|uniref:Uncharacterized protein n=1 Tax=Crucibulum laeve TaxID=68775 RepID=A0A5C3MDG5_9AGAR|nr:hypothetical protein BDQ12DRAFT_677085 [Crucibulum laeve]
MAALGIVVAVVFSLAAIVVLCVNFSRGLHPSRRFTPSFVPEPKQCQTLPDCSPPFLSLRDLGPNLEAGLNPVFHLTPSSTNVSPDDSIRRYSLSEISYTAKLFGADRCRAEGVHLMITPPTPEQKIGKDVASGNDVCVSKE